MCGAYVHKQGAEVKKAGKGGDLACVLSEGGVQLWPSSPKGCGKTKPAASEQTGGARQGVWGMWLWGRCPDGTLIIPALGGKLGFIRHPRTCLPCPTLLKLGPNGLKD